jgi:hypothetical protein
MYKTSLPSTSPSNGQLKQQLRYALRGWESAATTKLLNRSNESCREHEAFFVLNVSVADVKNAKAETPEFCARSSPLRLGTNAQARKSEFLIFVKS